MTALEIARSASRRAYLVYRRHVLQCPGGCAQNAYCPTERGLDAEAKRADWAVARLRVG